MRTTSTVATPRTGAPAAATLARARARTTTQPPGRRDFRRRRWAARWRRWRLWLLGGLLLVVLRHRRLAGLFSSAAVTVRGRARQPTEPAAVRVEQAARVPPGSRSPGSTSPRSGPGWRRSRRCRRRTSPAPGRTPCGSRHRARRRSPWSTAARPPARQPGLWPSTTPGFSSAPTPAGPPGCRWSRPPLTSPPRRWPRRPRSSTALPAGSRAGRPRRGPQRRPDRAAAARRAAGAVGERGALGAEGRGARRAAAAAVVTNIDVSVPGRPTTALSAAGTGGGAEQISPPSACLRRHRPVGA